MTKAITRKKSSPRLMVFDTSLMTAVSGIAKERYLNESYLRGHLIESAVGARLLARSAEEALMCFGGEKDQKRLILSSRKVCQLSVQ